MQMRKLMRSECLSSSYCQQAVSAWAYAQASVCSSENKKFTSDVTSSFVIYQDELSMTCIHMSCGAG